MKINILYLLAAFMIVLSHTLYIGAMPVALTQNNYNGLMLGLIIASFAIGALLGRLVIILWFKESTLSLTCFGALILISSQIGLVIFEAELIAAFFRVLNGLANSILFFSLFSVLPTLERSASRIIGSVGAGTAFALLVGAPLGLVIINKGKIGLLFQTGLFVSVVGSALAIGILIALKSRLVIVKNEVKNLKISERNYYYLLSVSLVMAGLGCLEVTLPLFIEYQGSQVITTSFIFFSIAFIVGRLQGGRHTQPTRLRGHIILASVVVACFAVVIALYSTPAIFFVTASILGLCFGYINTAIMVLIANGLVKESRSKALLSGQIFSDIGLAFGAAIGSTVFILDKNLSFVAIFVASVTTAGLIYWCGRRHWAEQNS